MQPFFSCPSPSNATVSNDSRVNDLSTARLACELLFSAGYAEQAAARD